MKASVRRYETMADFSQFASSPTLPVMPFSGFPLQVQNGGHETGANTILFMGFCDCTFGDDVVHISSVSLKFKLSHFDTCRLSDSC